MIRRWLSVKQMLTKCLAVRVSTQSVNLTGFLRVQTRALFPPNTETPVKHRSSPVDPKIQSLEEILAKVVFQTTLPVVPVLVPVFYSPSLDVQVRCSV